MSDDFKRAFYATDAERRQPLERIPVKQDGETIGTVPGHFDPLNIRSTSFLYDPRPGDFRREQDHWVADRMLGPGDLAAVPGFVWER